MKELKRFEFVLADDLRYKTSKLRGRVANELWREDAKRALLFVLGTFIARCNGKVTIEVNLD